MYYEQLKEAKTSGRELDFESLVKTASGTSQKKNKQRKSKPKALESTLENIPGNSSENSKKPSISNKLN